MVQKCELNALTIQRNGEKKEKCFAVEKTSDSRVFSDESLKHFRKYEFKSFFNHCNDPLERKGFAFLQVGSV